MLDLLCQVANPASVLLPWVFTLGQVITESTNISIGAAATAAVFLCFIAIGINVQIVLLKRTVIDIAKQQRETWSRKDQQIFALKLMVLNQKLGYRVPSIRCLNETGGESDDEIDAGLNAGNKR